MDTRRREIFYSLILLGLASALSLLILEMGLKAYSQFPIGYRAARPDDILGYVMRKRIPGVDLHGFRNIEVKTQADIIAIGDSHTYGYNAEPGDSWPGQLARLLDTPVYNMGIGGYSVVQYRELFNRALDKHPKTIIIAMFLPNDIREVCNMFATNAWWMNWAVTHQLDTNPCALDRPNPSPPKLTPQKWFTTKTAIGSLLSYYSKKMQANRDVKTGVSESGMVVTGLSSPTLLSRNKINGLIDNMDASKPYNQFGLAITETLFAEMSQLARQRQVTLKVLLIPSKQRVYYHAMRHLHKPLPEKLEPLVSNEEELTAMVKSILSKNNIAYAEMTDELALAVEQEADIYPVDEDGHPLAAGYRIYAAKALSLIKN